MSEGCYRTRSCAAAEAGSCARRRKLAACVHTTRTVQRVGPVVGGQLVRLAVHAERALGDAVGDAADNCAKVGRVLNGLRMNWAGAAEQSTCCACSQR